jgi:hypothetical protein
MPGFRALVSATCMALAVVVACKKAAPPKADGPAITGRYQPDEFLGMPAYRGMRWLVISASEGPCLDLSKKIDALYTRLNACSDDAQCGLLTPCDAINTSADTSELKKLMEKAEPTDAILAPCPRVPSPCMRGKRAMCRDGRCVVVAE